MAPKSLVVIGNPATMPEIRSNSIQLVVTSPPCCTYEQCGNGFFERYLTSMKSIFKECYRVLGDGRYICLNVPEASRVSSAHLIPILERAGFRYKDEIVWRNRKGQNSFIKNTYCTAYYPNDSFERVLFFKKGTIELYELTREERERCQFDLNFAFDHLAPIPDSMPKDIWERPEKALYPEELSEALIRLFTFEGETVLDPFLGCGTTVKVAKRIGRFAVGYGAYEEYLPFLGRKMPYPFSGIRIIKRGGYNEN